MNNLTINLKSKKEILKLKKMLRWKIINTTFTTEKENLKWPIKVNLLYKRKVINKQIYKNEHFQQKNSPKWSNKFLLIKWLTLQQEALKLIRRTNKWIKIDKRKPKKIKMMIFANCSLVTFWSQKKAKRLNLMPHFLVKKKKLSNLQMNAPSYFRHNQL